MHTRIRMRFGRLSRTCQLHESAAMNLYGHDAACVTLFVDACVLRAPYVLKHKRASVIGSVQYISAAPLEVRQVYRGSQARHVYI